MSDRFWDEAAPLQAAGRLEEGTIFGFRCVRGGKAFVAMPGHESDGMVAKLRAARVSELPVARPGRRPARSSTRRRTSSRASSGWRRVRSTPM